jgi:hypothetical protein
VFTVVNGTAPAGPVRLGHVRPAGYGGRRLRGRLFLTDRGPAHGRVTVTGDAGFTYTSTAGYAGPDQFATPA